MKRTVPLVAFALTLFILGCTKEDDVKATGFEGTVRLNDVEVSFTDIQVEVYGMASNPRCFLFCDGITKLNKVFPVEPDGSFAIQVTTEEVEYFRLGIRIEGERVFSECLPSSICSELRPGTNFSGLQLHYIE